MAKTFQQFAAKKTSVPVRITSNVYHDVKRGRLVQSDGTALDAENLTGEERDAIFAYAGDHASSLLEAKKPSIFDEERAREWIINQIENTSKPHGAIKTAFLQKFGSHLDFFNSVVSEIVD